MDTDLLKTIRLTVACLFAAVAVMYHLKSWIDKEDHYKKAIFFAVMAVYFRL